MRNAIRHRPAAVAITGLGAVTPFGDTAAALWEALTRGRHAFGPIELFDPKAHRTHRAAQIRTLPDIALQRLKPERLSRADRLCLAAARQALDQAGLLDNGSGSVQEPQRTAVVVGTAAGAILALERFFRLRRQGRRPENPRSLLESFCLSALATHLAREFRIGGRRMTLATVCSSSGLALAAAKDMIADRTAERVLVVGVETLSEVTHAGFNSLRSVASDRCRPFDRLRSGLILGEGAGAMVLEDPDAAAHRNRRPLAYLSGYGLTTDVHHFTAPRPDGAAVAETIARALADAGLSPESIDYVNAHATGTPLNDVAETRGLRRALGKRAERIPVSAVKSMTGHLLGAASILEAAVTVMTLATDRIPPTAHLEHPDPECDLDYVSEGCRTHRVAAAVSNSFAFGGSNISLVLTRERSAAVRARSVSDPLPVITGIGCISPFGLGKDGLRSVLPSAGLDFHAYDEGEDGSAPAPGRRVGVASFQALKERMPAGLRRRLNRPAAFLYGSIRAALADAGLAPDFSDANAGDGWAMTYGSAFGCSDSVHRFYSGILADGPRFASPGDFSLSVANAPPALAAQAMGFEAPIWSLAADEASWELALHWAAERIAGGRSRRVLVCAADEISDAIVSIHHALGLLAGPAGNGLVLGEGALCMVLESSAAAAERGARILGRMTGWAVCCDCDCGPQTFSADPAYLLDAVHHATESGRPFDAAPVCSGPENGMQAVDAIGHEVRTALSASQGGFPEWLRLRRGFGESGICSGLGLATLLLRASPRPKSILNLTCARGGLHAVTRIEPVCGDAPGHAGGADEIA